MFSRARKPPGSTEAGAGPEWLGGVRSWGQAQVSGKVLSTVGLWLFSVASPHFPSEYGKPNAAGILLRTGDKNTLDPTRALLVGPPQSPALSRNWG